MYSNEKTDCWPLQLELNSTFPRPLAKIAVLIAAVRHRNKYERSVRYMIEVEIYTATPSD
jgi:hypothetical protein